MVKPNQNASTHEFFQLYEDLPTCPYANDYSKELFGMDLAKISNCVEFQERTNFMMKLDQKYFELLHAKEDEEASLSQVIIEDLESGQDITK